MEVCSALQIGQKGFSLLISHLGQGPQFKFFQVVKEERQRFLLSLQLKRPLAQNNLYTTEAHLGVTHSGFPQEAVCCTWEFVGQQDRGGLCPPGEEQDELFNLCLQSLALGEHTVVRPLSRPFTGGLFLTRKTLPSEPTPQSLPAQQGVAIQD